MYNKLWIMVPTYKRLEWLKRFLDSSIDKADSINQIAFCVCINKKDAASRDFLINYFTDKKMNFMLTTEETRQPNLSLYFNLMYNAVDQHEAGHDFVATMFGDDMTFETKGYDTRLLSEINVNNGVGVFWCDDGYIAHDKLCVNVAVTKKFIEATERPFMCPIFKADMIDVVWYYVGQLTQTLHYLPDVLIQHRHSTGLAEVDQTFERLIPLQRQANSGTMHQYAQVYAAMCAGNVITRGMGSWKPL